MTNDLEAVQTWLQSSYSVQVPPDWLSACVEWIQQENGGHPLSVAQLQPMVFEQWLMSDLKELGTACLPADLPSKHCMDITGPLALQVESMLDVGVPLYGQLQKAKGTLNTNSEVSADKPYQPAWEPKPSRMLLLTMTDGQSEVKGMEYHPIPALNQDLQPGFKVAIHGQVKCRRGVLMLTADNLQVLGGEVDSLMETNTPVAVLEQAMELGRTNNGKHAKKEFSGRFLKKQDFKTGCQGLHEKKCKTEVTSSLLRQEFGRGQGGSGMTGRDSCYSDGVKKEPSSQSCAWTSGSIGVKQEPLSQPQAVGPEDEWEEDLDYGGLLDEPMEEDLPSGSESSATTNTARPQNSAAPPKKNPFACASNPTAAKPGKSWQEYNSANTVSSEQDRSTGQSGSSSWESETTNRYPSVTQQNGTITSTVQNDGRRVASQTSAMVDESMWGDDDDFAMEQVETDVLSPVIPVQTPLGQNTQNTNNCDSGISKQTGLQKTQNSLPTNTSKPNLVLNYGNSKTGVNSSAKSSPVLHTAPKTSCSSKPSQKPSENVKPPPSKQRKLTAMFSRTNTESKQAVNSTHPPPLPAVVDLTEEEIVSSVPDNGKNLVKETENVKHERKENSTADKAWTAREIVTVGGRAECQDTDMGDETHFKGEQTAGETPKETIPHAVIPPFTSQGEPLSSLPDTQVLKDVLPVLQCGTESGQTFTIKGHIATLTDRLRSCQGEQWTLSCRITDGSAAVEVNIADKVLTQLIGLTAKESVALRTQARKDASMKQFLTQGLEKCQTYLKEFSGLIDVQRGKGDSKPSVVNMVKLDTKKR